MKLYLMRHGLSQAVIEGKRQSPDTPLSTEGKLQVKNSVELLINKKICQIISSSWQRAKESAEIASQILKVSLEIDDCLHEKEQNPELYGKYEDEALVKEYKDQFEKNWNNFDWKLEGKGESINEVFFRAKKFERKLKKNEEKNILVVSHGHFLRCLVSVCLLPDNPQPIYNSLKFENAGITILRYDSDRCRWRLMNFY